MDTIFKVLSNLNHNGEQHLAGSFFQAERAEFEHLIADGILKVCAEATTVGEAIQQDAEEQERLANLSEDEAAQAEAQNTWGPKKPEPEAPVEEVKVEDAGGDTTTEAAAGEVGAGDVAPVVPPATETGDNL